MEKSRIAILLVAFVFIAMFAAGYIVYDALFPMATPVASPHPDSVVCFTVTDNKNEFCDANIYTFYDFLLNAEPTRIMSVNDYPDVRPYYEVILSDANKNYRYYVYSSNGKAYIEVPYFGVYEIKNFKVNDLFE